MIEEFYVAIPRIAVVLDLSAFDGFDNLSHAFLHDPHGRKTQKITYLIEIDTIIAAVRVRPLIYDPSGGYKSFYELTNLVNGVVLFIRTNIEGLIFYQRKRSFQSFENSQCGVMHMHRKGATDLRHGL